LVSLFEDSKNIKSGSVYSSISCLGNADPDTFSFAVTTVDGSQYSYGSEDFFSLQNCAWPFTYIMAFESVGEEAVHSGVGAEPCSSPGYSLTLNSDKKPHNPFTNSGAICVANCLEESDSSLKIANVLSKMSSAAGQRISCSMPAFVSMCNSSDRDSSIAFWLRSTGIIPKETDVQSLLHFYFQVCSMETDSQLASQLAACLANEGVSPMNGQKVFEPKIVRKCVSLLNSCGMNDNTSQWSESVGFTGKCGNSGAILIVIPKLMGIAIYSPRVDNKGVSARGMEFARLISQNFSAWKNAKF